MNAVLLSVRGSDTCSIVHGSISQRMDLGECPKVHDHALRADFEAASKERDYFYDIDAMEHLEEFISDCDRRTELAKKKLKETQDDLTEEATAKVRQLHTSHICCRFRLKRPVVG